MSIVSLTAVTLDSVLAKCSDYLKILLTITTFVLAFTELCGFFIINPSMGKNTRKIMQ